MTPEQIDLEFAHIAYDKKIKDKNGQVYEDDEYDKYDEDTEAYDSQISDMPSSVTQADPYKGKAVRTQDEDDWEDVETDDF